MPRFAGRRIRRLAQAVGLSGALATPGVARADLLALHASLRAGGFTGAGSAPDNAGKLDHFEAVRGPAGGFEVGAKLLVFDFSISFLQTLGGRGAISAPGTRFEGGGTGQIGEPGARLRGEGGLATGTLTQALLGVEMEFPLAAQLRIRPRIAGGVAIGTRHPVDLPLSNDEVSHKGLVAYAGAALERPIAGPLYIGAELHAGVHYLLGGRQVVNDARNWWTGTQVLAFLTMGARLGI